MRIVLAFLAMAIASLVAATAAASARWARATDDAVTTMTINARAVEPCSGKDLNALPAPVSRYLAQALTGGGRVFTRSRSRKTLKCS